MQTNRYCAFLRGVNVKGTTMKMKQVCDLFERCGMLQVSSILASGNILFNSETNKDRLKEILEKALSEHFNYEAFLFLKDIHDLQELVDNSPFEAHPDYHIYGFVGIEGIEKTLLQEFNNSIKQNDEEIKIIKNNLYWQVRKGSTLDSDFGKILGRKSLKNSFTSRNMNTFKKVLKQM